MAFVLISEVWCDNPTGHRREFLCDTEEDVSTLPDSCPGSSALVSDTGCIYIVNASGRWVEFGGKS